MTETEKLIHDLRQLGKYSRLEPNWLRLAADKIEELSGRVEVVRCWECRHFDPVYKHCDHYMGTGLPFPRKENDFCSYGGRKESEVQGE